MSGLRRTLEHAGKQRGRSRVRGMNRQYLPRRVPATFFWRKRARFGQLLTLYPGTSVLPNPAPDGRTGTATALTLVFPRWCSYFHKTQSTGAADFRARTEPTKA